MQKPISLVFSPEKRLIYSFRPVLDALSDPLAHRLSKYQPRQLENIRKLA